MKLGEEDRERAAVNQLGLTNPVLEVQIVKKYQSYSLATFDIRVANRSNKPLRVWAIDASIYDSNGAYLSRSLIIDYDLKPEAEVYKEMSFEGVNYHNIGSWKPQISVINIEVSGVKASATRHFTLNELKSQSW